MIAFSLLQIDKHVAAYVDKINGWIFTSIDVPDAVQAALRHQKPNTGTVTVIEKVIPLGIKQKGNSPVAGAILVGRIGEQRFVLCSHYGNYKEPFELQQKHDRNIVFTKKFTWREDDMGRKIHPRISHNAESTAALYAYLLEQGILQE